MPLTVPPVGDLPRLSAELVPSTCWVSDVRSLMRERAWKRLAAEVADDGGRPCEICGGRGHQHAVECHEVWHYDDRRGVQLLMRLQALCPMCHLVKHLGRSANAGLGRRAYAWLAQINGWDQLTTERYVGAVFEQWAARSRRTWTLDLTVLGAAYDVKLDDLGLERYVLAPREREQIRHGRAARVTDAHRRDAGTAREERPQGTRNAPKRTRPGAPRNTKQTRVPSSRRPAVDWVKIARSGTVWEFLEGEDFTGNAANFRARAKTAARKCGVDFESVELQRGERTVLKILAFVMPTESQLELDSPPGPPPMTQLTLPI